jgi:hypothetical protein
VATVARVEDRDDGLSETQTGSRADKWHGNLPYIGARLVDKAGGRHMSG